MRPDGPHLREELGAHVLGLLDGAESRAVEAHLAGCAPCRREWGELRDMTELLGEVPPEAFLDGPPDGDLVLQRTLRQLRAEAAARRSRRRLGGLAAAAVALVAVLGGGVVVGRATAPEPVPALAAGARVLQGTGDGGVTMTATVRPAAGWVRVSVTVAGIAGGERCHLVVVARDGRREIAGSWVTSAAGERGGTQLDGAAAVAPDEVAAVLVANEAGREFVVLRA
jgi:anti-sigma factor RsiW